MPQNKELKLTKPARMKLRSLTLCSADQLWSDDDCRAWLSDGDLLPKLTAAAAVALAQLFVGTLWSVTSELALPLATIALVHFIATPACLALLRTAGEFNRLPVLGPTMGVTLVLVGCGGVAMFHDALEGGVLSRLPPWSGVLIFVVAVFAAVLFGMAVDEEGQPQSSSGALSQSARGRRTRG